VLFTMAKAYPEAPIYTLFCDFDGLKARYPEFANRIHVHPKAQRAYKLGRKIPLIGKQVSKLFLPYYGRWVEEIDFSDYDTVIANSTAWGLGVVTPSWTKLIAYVHSPARYLWDYYPDYKRELGSKGQGSLRDTLLTYSLSRRRLENRVSADRPDAILCNSTLVADRIAKFYRRKATVLYPPVDIDNISCTGASPQSYALILSTLTPYKNIDKILSWWGDRETKLLIAGDGPDRERLKKLAGKNVTFLGYVSQEKKTTLLEEARLLFYPSMEDFGIGPIEAMAAGKLTIALGKGGALETVTDGQTGIFVTDLSQKSLDHAWEKFCTIEKNYTANHLRISSERFSRNSFLHSLSSYIDAS